MKKTHRKELFRIWVLRQPSRGSGLAFLKAAKHRGFFCLFGDIIAGFCCDATEIPH